MYNSNIVTAGNDSIKTINDYKFNKKCKDFLDAIESDYKYKIVIIEKNLTNAEDGWASVNDDVPTIEVNVNAQDKEVKIIHEAFHLLLRYNGYPSIEYEFTKTEKSETNRIYLEWFTHLFWDKITHYYFYPIMHKDFNINPYNSFNEEVIKILSDGKIECINNITGKIKLAGTYLQIWIETQNETTLARYEKFISQKYNNEGLELGILMVNKFKSKKIKNSNDAIDLFIYCFNVIHLENNLKIDKPEMFYDNHKNYKQCIANFKIETINH